MKYPSSMTAYERRAWENLVADERSRRSNWRARAGDKAAGVVSAAGAMVKRVPGADELAEFLDEKLKQSLNGAAKAVFLPAVYSVSMERRIRQLRKQHPGLADTSLFDVLDLSDLDKGRPRQILPLVGATGSAAASVAITGAEVSTTVSGGATAGVIVLAIAGDVTATLALLGRAIAEVAVHYGFDPNDPGEEIFLVGVLSYSTAASVQGKATALAGLARLSQKMMRRATWKQLEKEAVVRVIQRVFTSIGIRLTHKRLAQAVPVVGGLISAGLSYDMLDRARRDATRVYRVRYLTEKYGMSFDDWVKRAMAKDANEFSEEHPDDEEYADVDAALRDAIAATSGEKDPPAGEDSRRFRGRF